MRNFNFLRHPGPELWAFELFGPFCAHRACPNNLGALDGRRGPFTMAL